MDDSTNAAGAFSSPSGDSKCGFEDQLKFNKSQRKFYRAKATRLCNHITTLDTDNISLDHRLQLKADLLAIGGKLNKFNDCVSNVIWKTDKTEAEMQEEFKACDEYDNNISQSVRRLDIVAVDPNTASRSVAGADHGRMPVAVSNQLKLPQIPLPEFRNAKTESFELFVSSFESIIDKYNLNQFEKYVFLERQLKGEPLILVKSLGSNQQSYDAAKDLLLKAFASPINVKFDIIKRMTELKLDFPGEPYRFISEMRIIQDSFRDLKVDSDTILQYFVWKGLNSQFRNILINITNETKPSLDIISNNIFKATERYTSSIAANSADRSCRPVSGITEDFNSLALNVQYRNSNQNKSTSFECEGSNYKFKPCILCKLDCVNVVDHPIFKCIKYQTPNSKVLKLKSINGCVKCGYDNHSARECKYKFQRACRGCSKYHFDYLCISDAKRDSSSVAFVGIDQQNCEDDTSFINSSSVTIYSTHLTFDNSKKVILPTFSCKIANGKTLRAMKDSGAQCSFILDSVAKVNKLKIVKRNISLNVNGFNSSQNFNTNVVSVKANFGPKTYEFLAIVVPKINTILKLPNLNNIAREFTNRGIVLADMALMDGGDLIDDLELILGSNASYCLPEQTVVFGEHTPSSYINTPIGAMLVGSVELLLHNLKFLPLMSEKSVELCGDSGSVDETDFSFDVNHIVVDDAGKLIQSQIERASDEALNNQLCPYLDQKCQQILDYKENSDEDISEENNKLINYVLENAGRLPQGNLVLPLTWNSKVKHLLGQNFLLSKQILLSNLRKFKKVPEHLNMIDDSFKDQVKLGVIERIHNIDQFLDEHPEACFLAHMPIFRFNHESTKCRNVYLSNITGKDPNKSITLSNNQCMLAGPCLNNKISTSLIQLRFDKYLLCFDLVKAFLQVALSESDSLKLCFLWFKNVQKNDFEIIGYKSTKLPFGLKCSPFLLMIGLYKILIMDWNAGDSDKLVKFKKLLFSNFYMDNGACTTNDEEYLNWAYNQLPGIFNPYSFSLQQFYTNNVNLHDKLAEGKESFSKEVKLLGMNWNRATDTISTPPLCLNDKASTKREVLSSIASNYDIYNINGPLINRARLFMHKLQCSSDIGWDTCLSSNDLRTWKNISKQINSSPVISVSRSVGSRSDTYSLISFVDSSKSIVGIVVYLYNINSNKLSFLLARNKIIGKSLGDKSIPSLELTAINFGADTLIKTYNELAGKFTVVPIKIENCYLFTDSLICLNWLNLYTVKMDKMKNKSVYVMNKLANLVRLCEIFPIKFKFCNGIINPSDCMTRELSYKQLIKSNFISGPDFILKEGPDLETLLTVIIPNPILQSGSSFPDMAQESSVMCSVAELSSYCVIDYGNYSKYSKMLNVSLYVLRFINNLKCRLKAKNGSKFAKFDILNSNDLEKTAFVNLIKYEQKISFPEECSYFSKTNKGNINEIPPLVLQLNLIVDSDGLLRVKSKFGRWKNKKFSPILLSKNGYISAKLIEHFHIKLSHAGVYTVLNELRKEFWIPCIFSTVKKALRSCIKCRRLNNRPTKLNQSAFRDFRVNPPNIPFRALFLDYLGPFFVKNQNKKNKVYILLFTCLWSRAVNLKVCTDLSVQQFLRAFQTHCFEFGVPEICHSDLGSQIVSASNLIHDFLDDEPTREYFREKGLNPLSFKQFPKGNKELGGIVEICVKLVKRLLFGAIGKNVLSSEDFQFIVYQTVHLVNKRPVCLNESLRDTDILIPTPITAEMIVRGYELPSVNLIPELQQVSLDPDWSGEVSSDGVNNMYQKLSKVRKTLIDTYNDEFLALLFKQATNKKGRFIPVKHNLLNVGDIVLLKEDYMKPINFPLGKIELITKNYLGEITDVTVYKGSTGESIKRHSTAIIPLLSVLEYSKSNMNSIPPDRAMPCVTSGEKAVKTKRAAAVESSKKTKQLLQQGLM